MVIEKTYRTQILALGKIKTTNNKERNEFTITSALLIDSILSNLIRRCPETPRSTINITQITMNYYGFWTLTLLYSSRRILSLTRTAAIAMGQHHLPINRRVGRRPAARPLVMLFFTQNSYSAWDSKHTKRRNATSFIIHSAMFIVLLGIALIN